MLPKEYSMENLKEAMVRFKKLWIKEFLRLSKGGPYTVNIFQGNQLVSSNHGCSAFADGDYVKFSIGGDLRTFHFSNISNIFGDTIIIKTGE